MAEKKHKHASTADEGNMTLTGHLKELRNRIIVCVVALFVSFFVGLYFAPSLIDFLTDMGRGLGYSFIYVSPQELLLQQFSLSLIAGVIITLPILLYNIYAFIQPGLKKNENRLLRVAFLAGIIFFIFGVMFAYKVMLPFMLDFLIKLSSGTGIKASVTVGNYVSFLLTIFIIFGIIFELPVVSVILTQLGLLKVQWMKSARKVMIVVIFVVAALITPPDIVSQIMVACPMILLYEFSIVVCTVLLKFKKKPLSEETDTENDDEV